MVSITAGLRLSDELSSQGNFENLATDELCVIQGSNQYTKSDFEVNLLARLQGLQVNFEGSNDFRILSSKINELKAKKEGYKYLRVLKDGVQGTLGSTELFKKYTHDLAGFWNLYDKPALCYESEQPLNKKHAQCWMDSGKRHSSWSKVDLVSRILKQRPDCKVLLYIDLDACMVHDTPVHKQPQIQAWLASKDEDKMFIAREPSVRNPGVDFFGMNDLNPTKINTGFFLIKNTEPAQDVLTKWWSAGLFNPAWKVYHVAHFAEQKILHELYVKGNVKLSIANEAADYNSPVGRFVKHIWGGGICKTCKWDLDWYKSNGLQVPEEASLKGELKNILKTLAP